jgi:hypothetical protein
MSSWSSLGVTLWSLRTWRHVIYLVLCRITQIHKQGESASENINLFLKKLFYTLTHVHKRKLIFPLVIRIRQFYPSLVICYLILVKGSYKSHIYVKYIFCQIWTELYLKYHNHIMQYTELFYQCTPHCPYMSVSSHKMW